MKKRPFGWRQLLGAVNLKDFVDMVRGELEMIGSSARLALEAFRRLPLGPLAFLGGMLLVLLRLLLLLLVVVLFGTGILVITAVRGAARLALGRKGAEPP